MFWLGGPTERINTLCSSVHRRNTRRLILSSISKSKKSYNNVMLIFLCIAISFYFWNSWSLQINCTKRCYIEQLYWKYKDNWACLNWFDRPIVQLFWPRTRHKMKDWGALPAFSNFLNNWYFRILDKFRYIWSGSQINK